MQGRVLSGEVFVGLGGGELLQRAASHPVDRGMRSAIKPYTSAEIPPAGAPSGFDSAAMVGFCARPCIVMPLRSE